MSEISEDSNLLKGVVRLGKYELIAPVGRGGMAQVFLARQVGDHAFQKIVVIKSIHEELLKSKGFIEMLLDEARIAALIKHANVVDIYDLGQDNGRYYIAMEYISGRPLSKVLGRSKGTGIMLDVLSVAHVIAEAADGLHAAHTLKSLTGEHLNVVHRDVTPGNIMVSYDGNVKLVDFGVAKSIGKLSDTETGQLKGKLGYLSPEQVNGVKVTPQTDLFALGVCLWESLAVARLFTGEMGPVIAQILNKDCSPPSEHRPEVPGELDRICLKALSRDPAKRYQSAADMRDDLQALLRGSSYFQGRRIVAEHMERQFAADIIADRKLVTQKGFTAEIGPGIAETSLSPPRASTRSPTVDYHSTTPAPAQETDKVAPLVEPLEDAIRPKRRFPPIAVAAGALGGILVLVLVLRALFGGGDLDEKAEASVDDETPAVAQVDEVPEPVEPVVMPDAATEPLAVDPVSVDASVEIAVVDPVKPQIKPKIKPATKGARAKALFASGKKKLARSDVMGAKKDLAASLKLRPGHAGTLKAMARAYEKAGVKSKALQFYRKYLKRSPRAKDRKTIEARIRLLGG